MARKEIPVRQSERLLMARSEILALDQAIQTLTALREQKRVAFFGALDIAELPKDQPLEISGGAVNWPDAD